MKSIEIKNRILRKGLSFVAVSALLLGNIGAASFASAQEVPANNPTTNAATSITQSDATLNAVNGPADASGHSFWASLAPFDTSSPNLPSGVYSTDDFGSISSSTPFSAQLSQVNGLPAITPGTNYYFAAWSLVDGTWYPGQVLNFSTVASSTDGGGGDTGTTTATSTVKVTIDKYIDNAPATAASASSTSFQMNASWSAENIGTGSGQYALGPTGYYSSNPYEAVTADMTSGANYSTNEITDGNVGSSCDAGTPYALVGYSTGSTTEAAASAEVSQTSPSFTGMTNDEAVIVWNKTCSNDSGTGSTTGTTTATFSPTTNAATNITESDATLNGTNGTADATDHSFWVSTSTYSTESPTIPAGVYSTTDLGNVASNTPFSASLSSVNGLPAVTGSTTYYYNAWSYVDGTWYPGQILTLTTGSATSTGGTIGGTVTGGEDPNGTLQVTSVDTIRDTATADGNFADGWEYVFHITMPTSEQELSMKFSDWASTSGSSTIPVANNVRISSGQSDDASSTVLITAPDTYSSPALNMVTDLDPTTPGRQVEVTVEAAIPANSVNGSYTTNYGVRTLSSDSE